MTMPDVATLARAIALAVEREGYAIAVPGLRSSSLPLERIIRDAYEKEARKTE